LWPVSEGGDLTMKATAVAGGTLTSQVM
jgi:hypothetical protein